MAPDAPRRPVPALRRSSLGRAVVAVAALVAGIVGPAASGALAAGTRPSVCKEAAAFHTALAAIKDLSSPRLPAAAKALHPAVVRFRSAAGRAPAAVRADWSALAAALARIDSALQKTVTTKGLVKGRERDALYALMRTLDGDPTLNKAATAVDRWLDQACGLTPHYGTTPVPALTGTAPTASR